MVLKHDISGSRPKWVLATHLLSSIAHLSTSGLDQGSVKAIFTDKLTSPLNDQIHNLINGYKLRVYQKPDGIINHLISEKQQNNVYQMYCWIL